MTDIAGRVVMITGGSEGLGMALALAFAEAGSAVSICARDPEAVSRAGDRIAATGAPFVAEVSDVSDEAAVARWVERTQRELGDPRVLINNASVLGLRVRLDHFPLAEWHRVLDVNLTGALAVTQSVLPAFARLGGGSVINVSSGAATPPRVEWGAYAVSKTALEAMSLNLAEELKASGIRVNIVDPGPMRTGMRAAAYPREDPASLSPPSRIAELFLWLASDSSDGVTGRRIVAAEWLAKR